MKKFSGLLTKDFLKENYVVFLLTTHEDAHYLQQELFALGCEWINSKQKYIVSDLNLECIKVKQGVMTHGLEGAEFGSTTYLCHLSNIDGFRPKAQGQELSPQEKWLGDKFNAVSTEIAALREEINKLKQEITPDDNFLPFKTPGQQP